jgi:hypothetical protein
MKIVKLEDVTKSLSGTPKSKENILDSNKPLDVKLKLHMGALYSILKHFYDEKKKSKFTQSVEVSTETEKGIPKEMEIQTEEDDADTIVNEPISVDRAIINSFKSHKLQENASELLDKLGTIMSWNAKREIIYKGGVIPKSDIRELVDYLVRRQTTKYRPFYFTTIENDLKKLEIEDLCAKKQQHGPLLRSHTYRKSRGSPGIRESE